MKKLLLLTLLISLFIAANTQTVILEEDVPHETELPKWGKNYKHYGYLYFSWGLFADPSEEGADIKYGRSGDWSFGYRYKYKVCDYYALGADLNFSFAYYNMKDSEDKILPDNILHEKEVFYLYRIKGEVFQRINFDRRGNSLGKYLDLGAFAGYKIASMHFTSDEPDEQQYEINDVTERRLKYFEDISYGVKARIGYKTFALFGEYRLSDLMKKTKYQSEKYPELPRFVIGIDFKFDFD